MAVLASSDPTRYWAAEPDSERAAANVLERIRRYRQWLKDSGRASKMLASLRAYQGRAPDGNGDTSKTGQSGDQGEYVDVTTNDYATLVTQTVVLTTQNKPSLHAIATNSDYDSMAQTEFAQGLIEFYDRKHSVQDRDYETVLTGTLMSEGWEIEGWDATAGKSLTDFAPDSAQVHEGDIKLGSYTPFRVAYDFDTQDVEALQWLCFKTRVNRFDLAATLAKSNPKASEKLLSLGTNPADETDDLEGDDFDPSSPLSRDVSGDRVWVWEFRHLPSPALPNGRLMRLVSAECVLFDSIETKRDEATNEAQIDDHGYGYSDLGAQRYAPDSLPGSIAGHTGAFDLLGLQELIDTIATMAASAANAGGISNLWCPPGGKPSLTAVVGTMNFVESPTKPELLKGVELSAQVPELENFLEKRMMRRLGQSDVSMGDVPKGMPGNLAALLEAKTVQYHSRGQASYAQMIERRATSTLKILQRYAKTERVAVLGGKANAWKYKAWTSENIAGVDRFVVESVSPLTQSYAGKMDAAEQLLQHGLIDGKQFMSIRETGRWESVTEAPDSNLMRIRKEKEMLQDGIGLPPIDIAKSMEASQKASVAAGKPVNVPIFVDEPMGQDGKAKQYIRPLLYDKHWDDIPEFLAVADMPMARDNRKLVDAVLGVVEEKIRLMKQIDPVMLAVLKCPGSPEVAQAIAMSQAPMMLPGPPGVAPPPVHGGTSSSQPPKQAASPGLPAGAPRIAAAKPPRNPLTGEQAPSPIINGAS